MWHMQELRRKIQIRYSISSFCENADRTLFSHAGSLEMVNSMTCEHREKMNWGFQYASNEELVTSSRADIPVDGLIKFATRLQRNNIIQQKSVTLIRWQYVQFYQITLTLQQYVLHSRHIDVNLVWCAQKRWEPLV